MFAYGPLLAFIMRAWYCQSQRRQSRTVVYSMP